jgi:hypothetical protein
MPAITGIVFDFGNVNAKTAPILFDIIQRHSGIDSILIALRAEFPDLIR